MFINNLLAYIKKGETLKYVKNTSWLLGENLLKLISGVFIGAWLARYLGPENFGAYSYAMALVAVFGGIATLGLDNIIIRELVRNSDDTEMILGTSFILRLFGVLISLSLLSVGVSVFGLSDQTKALVFFMSLSLVFQLSTLIKLYFQSVILIKYFAISSVISIILSSIVKVCLIVSGAEVVDFAKAFLFDSFILAIFLMVFYFKTFGAKKSNYKFNNELAINMLQDCWPLIIAGVASVIKLKLGQLMLAHFASFEDVGYYAAAQRISELWFLIPVLLGTSIYPLIIKARGESEKHLSELVLKITKVMMMLAIPLAIFISFISEYLMTFLFGSEYQESGHYLSLLIWSGLPYVVLFAYSQVTYIEGKTQIHLYVSILSIASIAFFNYWFIPLFGGIGAVYASLITALLGTVLMIVLIEKDIKIFTKGTKYV